ncbi:MAG: hypothetical protein ACFFDI_27855 [Promethearchaeota archaeon]
MVSIRPANITEINLVKKEIKDLTGSESFSKIFSSTKRFLIQRDKKIKFIVVDALLAEFLFKALSNIQPFLYSVGLCLALFNSPKGPCKITLEGLHLVAPYSRRKIILDSKETLKFLYGRNILLKGITNLLNVNRNEKTLVFDQSNRVLGIGVLKKDFLLIPIVDLGYYLRKKLK